MTHDQAAALTNSLSAEALEAGLLRCYVPLQAANTDVWAVEESDGSRTIQVWVSPDLSFPL